MLGFCDNQMVLFGKGLLAVAQTNENIRIVIISPIFFKDGQGFRALPVSLPLGVDNGRKRV